MVGDTVSQRDGSIGITLTQSGRRHLDTATNAMMRRIDRYYYWRRRIFGLSLGIQTQIRHTTILVGLSWQTVSLGVFL